MRCKEHAWKVMVMRSMWASVGRQCFLLHSDIRAIAAFSSSSSHFDTKSTGAHHFGPVAKKCAAHRRSPAFFTTSLSAFPPDDDDDDEQQEDRSGANNLGGRRKTRKKKSSKIEINPNWRGDYNEQGLKEAFDKLAKAEGFDESTAFYAELDEDNNDDDGTGGFGDFMNENNEDNELGIAPEHTVAHDLEANHIDDADRSLEFNDVDVGESMVDRLEAAKKDVVSGIVSVPKELDAFATDASFEDIRKLGFKREVNPYGADETPRKDDYAIVENALRCTACGTDFQCTDDRKPGFLPKEKFDVQVKLSKIEQLQNSQAKADSSEWSSEDEVEWLIQNSGKDLDISADDVVPQADVIDVAAMAEELDLDLADLARKKVICKRCHGLQNFGEVDVALRPGWTDEPLLSQEAFRRMLQPLQKKRAVIVALVDLFDFSGSVLPELDSIAGENPVILAANKADLLPSKMGQVRAENWVRRELEYLGIQCLANIGGAVRLVSCKTGFGINGLLTKARSLAEEMDSDIYLVGAANAGKSTLVNRILQEQGRAFASKRSKKDEMKRKKRPGNTNARKEAVTTSPLPGTTLKFIKVDVEGGRSLYDTPGLLVPGSLTQRLTPAELKIVVPKKEVEPITFRVASGKCVLVGGLARIEVIGETKPFLFTFFVANDIKLHPTDSSKADEFVLKHVGELLTPPLAPGEQRMAEIGEFESHTIEINGCGWKEAAADITLRGLGWVSITGAGTAKVRVSVPKGIGISVRPPLMPFDVWEATAKFTGGRAVRKSGKTKTGKRRKGVGRK